VANISLFLYNKSGITMLVLIYVDAIIVTSSHDQPISALLKNLLGSSGAAARRAREACNVCAALWIGRAAKNIHTKEQEQPTMFIIISLHGSSTWPTQTEHDKP
jgi:hypothetical protein